MTCLPFMGMGAADLHAYINTTIDGLDPLFNQQ